jgi:HSP20 family protein
MLLANPFEALGAMQRALDRYYESDWLSSMPSASGPFPPINVFRKGDDVVVIAELPGVKKSDIAVQIKDDTIRISGTKALAYGKAASLHRAERQEGGFDRVVQIPVNVDAAKAKAEYRDGILALLLPRAEQDRPKTIAVD